MQSLRVLDLNTVVGEISRMLPRLIGEDIQLVFVPGRDLVKVKADPAQIEQVVMNLATNARDAMPARRQATIETSNVSLDQAYVQQHAVVPAGEYALLAVSDSGEGIAAEHLNHIFEPFYTTKEAGKGTGLGLATAYGIVKQSGGFIWVYSEPDRAPRLRSTCQEWYAQVKWKALRRWHRAPPTDRRLCFWWKTKPRFGPRPANFWCDAGTRWSRQRTEKKLYGLRGSTAGRSI